MWVSAHTLTVRTDSLTCHGLSVEGAGDANRYYHQERGKHAYGRPVYRQAREPYCTIHVETWGWSVKNNGNTLVSMPVCSRQTLWQDMKEG